VACTPSGSDFRISWRRASSRRETSRLFSPMSMNPRPSTISPSPSAVTAPRRISRPSTTRATSRTRVGTPSRAATMMPSTSSIVATAPTPWMSADWPAWSSVPPPTLALFRSSASASSPSVSPCFAR